jgi:hypothetical protein
MKGFLKRHGVIVVAFLLPVSLIVFIALTSYLPSLLLSTNYDFLYSTCSGRWCDNYLEKRYSVVEGRLVVNEIDPTWDLDENGVPDIDEKWHARIFLHDTEKNESREIDVEEARTFELSGLLTSPDGVTVSSGYDRGADFFLFYGGSSHGYYLTKGKRRSKLNIINSDEYWRRENFQFIGWILPGRD